jgi:sulfoxide reductase heme-binding subunit YedZ
MADAFQALDSGSPPDSCGDKLRGNDELIDVSINEQLAKIRAFIPVSAGIQIFMKAMPWLKPSVFVLCLLPLGRLGWLSASNGLGANPIEFLIRSLGTWTLALLLITLSVTPLRRLTGWNALIRVRRMLGLFAFFYACLHFLAFFGLDQFFDLRAVIADIAKRPYITVGFTCLVLLVPLAVTSTAAMQRRLGGKRWQRLHRLVYLIAIGGVVHYWWLVKKDITQPLLYGLVLVLLLGLRVWWPRSVAVSRPPG